MTAVRAERVEFAGPGGTLEGIVEDPGAAAATRYGVICHPHPLYGGTMDNKVVVTVVRALRDAGLPSLRFNFRGVGRSAGTYDAGMGETDDAAAAAAYGAARWPGLALVAAGFSFGSFVALRLAQQLPVAQLITIAPPVQRFDYSAGAAPTCPWLVVQGDADEVVDPQAVYAWVARLEPKPQLVVMPGVGHFFHGRLNELRDAVFEMVRSG
jgi:alpha/beta superfamily hydrolase